MVESSSVLGTTATGTAVTATTTGSIGDRVIKFLYTWIIRFGSVSIGLVVIAGTVLYMQQDNLLVRSSCVSHRHRQSRCNDVFLTTFDFFQSYMNAIIVLSRNQWHTTKTRE